MGTLNEDTITAADVKLVEGPRGKPDDLTVDLAFDRLDANVLLAAKKKGPVAEADVPLTVDRSPDMLIAAKVAAHELTYAGIRASDVTFGGSLKPGRIMVDVLSLGYLGSPFRASGQIEAMPGPGHTDGGRVTANVDMNRMDVQVLRKLLAAGDLPLLGRIDGKVLVEATGHAQPGRAQGPVVRRVRHGQRQHLAPAHRACLDRCAHDFSQGGWNEPDFLPGRRCSTFVVASGRYRRCAFAARMARSPGVDLRHLSPPDRYHRRERGADDQLVRTRRARPRQRLVRIPNDPTGNSLGCRSRSALGRRQRKPAAAQPAAIRAAQSVLVRPGPLARACRQLSQTTLATRWTAARKSRAVFS